MKRTVGRPRDVSVDGKVIESTLDLLNDVGLAGLSVEGIASRAAVSKATIYRRWQSKEEILVDAVASVVQDFDVPDSGDIRRDLTAAVTGMLRFIGDSRAGDVFPWLVSEIARQTYLGMRYVTTVIAPRRAMIAGLLAHAVERGALREDLDVETAVDLLTGPVIVRRITGRLTEPDDDWPAGLVDSLLQGWAS